MLTNHCNRTPAERIILKITLIRRRVKFAKKPIGVNADRSADGRIKVDETLGNLR